MGRPDDAELLAALRAGDERAFVTLVETHEPALRRLARLWVRQDRAVADIIRKTWLVVLDRLDALDERTALRGRLYGTLIDVARAQVDAERRNVPLAELAMEETAAPEPAVEPAQFEADGDRWAGHWLASPAPFPSAGAALDRRRLERTLEAAILELTPVQRQVLALRDVEGCSSAETSQLLGVSGELERALLGRARAKLRQRLARHFAEAGRS